MQLPLVILQQLVPTSVFYSLPRATVYESLALVSVVLRVPEYDKGTPILTVGGIDTRYKHGEEGVCPVC